MTAKQKAEELTNKFIDYAYEYEVVNSKEDEAQWNAKQCALICVDEVLSIEGNYLISTDYWKEVKQEINQV